MPQSSIQSELPIGERLIGIRRVHYVCGAMVDASEGPLELSFNRSGSYLIRAGADGESIVVTRGRWVDDFKDPVSDENDRYLWESGKWEAIDLGVAAWSYRQYIGRTLCDHESPEAGSLLLDFGGYFIEAKAGGDELRVKFSRVAS